MTFPEEIVHKRRGGGEYRAVLLVRVRRCDEEAASELVARHVGRAQPSAEESRAMRFADTGKAHHHDKHGPSVRRRGYGRDLSAELRRKDLRARRVRVRLCRRRGARRPADLGHVPKPSALSASRAAVASSYGRLSSPTMIDSSCPLPARRTVSSALARRIASPTASWRSSLSTRSMRRRTARARNRASRAFCNVAPPARPAAAAASALWTLNLPTSGSMSSTDWPDAVIRMRDPDASDARIAPCTSQSASMPY